MGHATTKFGGLSGKQMAAILGVAETKVNQAAEPALDRAAIIALANPQAFFQALADRMNKTTPGMQDINLRREAMLEREQQMREEMLEGRLDRSELYVRKRRSDGAT